MNVYNYYKLDKELKITGIENTHITMTQYTYLNLTVILSMCQMI